MSTAAVFHEAARALAKLERIDRSEAAAVEKAAAKARDRVQARRQAVLDALGGDARAIVEQQRGTR